MEKRARSLSQRNFNKAIDRYETFILNDNVTLEEHEVMFQDVSNAWLNVQEKHEQFILSIPEDQDCDYGWIDDLESKYHVLRSKKCAFERGLKDSLVLKEKEKKDVSVKSLRESELQVQMIKLKERFNIEVNRLTNISKTFKTLEDVNNGILKGIKCNFDKQLQIGDDIFQRISEMCINENMELIVDQSIFAVSDEFLQHFYQMSSKLSCPEKGAGDISEQRKPLMHMEKMKFPKFNGNCRDWPQFKKDFEMQVSSAVLDATTVSYALRNALPDNVKSLIRNMSDDITEMWKRLDERFGDEAKIVEVVLNDIKSFRPIRENEEKRLLYFIDTIEKATNELIYLGREAEIQNSTIIGLIEEKLPDDLKRKWVERIYEKNSPVDKKDKFPGFLKFLLERKLIIEYECNISRKTKEEKKVNVKLKN